MGRFVGRIQDTDNYAGGETPTTGNVLYWNGTAWSTAAVSVPVTSVFGRTGAVVLLSGDVTTALGFTPQNSTVSNAQDVSLAPATSARNVVVAGAAAVLPLTLRGAASQSADHLQTQDSTSAIVHSLRANGSVYHTHYLEVNDLGAPYNTSSCCLTLASSTKTNFILGYNGGNPFFGVSRLGHIALGSGPQAGKMFYAFQDASATPVIYINSTDNGVAATSNANQITCADSNNVSTFTVGGSGKVTISPVDAAVVPLTIKAVAVQTADRQRWTDSANVVNHRNNKDGYMITAKTAAPADADLVAGEAAYWLDQTVGTAKFMVKAKNSAGTVVTGSINLT